MSDASLVLLLVGGTVAFLGGFAWFATRVRRSGVGAAVMGPIDEIYRPTAHRFSVEIQVQDERGDPSPSADGLPRPLHP